VNTATGVMMLRGLSWLKVGASDCRWRTLGVVSQIVRTVLGRGKTSGLSELTVLHRLTWLV